MKNYVWTLGNDDLILPSLKVLKKILTNNKKLNFLFY